MSCFCAELSIMKQRTLQFVPVARLPDRRRDGAVVANAASTVELAEGVGAVVVDNMTVTVSGTESAAPVDQKDTTVTPTKKPRRDLSIAHKVMILNANGWQTGETFLDWVKESIGFEKNPMLIIDLFSAHRDASVIDWCKIEKNLPKILR